MEKVEELKEQDLVGLKIDSICINEDKDIVWLRSGDDDFFLSWYGDCCAKCFLTHVEGVQGAVGSTIMSVESAEWRRIKDDEDFEVIESMGTKIKTTTSYITLESRLVHNGYYAGHINITKGGPVGRYGEPAELHVINFKPLQDF